MAHLKQRLGDPRDRTAGEWLVPRETPHQTSAALEVLSIAHIASLSAARPAVVCEGLAAMTTLTALSVVLPDEDEYEDSSEEEYEDRSEEEYEDGSSVAAGLEAYLPSLTRLRSLTLDRCGLTAVPSSLAALTALTALSLRDNLLVGG